MCLSVRYEFDQFSRIFSAAPIVAAGPCRPIWWSTGITRCRSAVTVAVTASGPGSIRRFAARRRTNNSAIHTPLTSRPISVTCTWTMRLECVTWAGVFSRYTLLRYARPAPAPGRREMKSSPWAVGKQQRPTWLTFNQNISR